MNLIYFNFCKKKDPPNLNKDTFHVIRQLCLTEINIPNREMFLQQQLQQFTEII